MPARQHSLCATALRRVRQPERLLLAHQLPVVRTGQLLRVRHGDAALSLDAELQLHTRRSEGFGAALFFASKAYLTQTVGRDVDHNRSRDSLEPGPLHHQATQDARRHDRHQCSALAAAAWARGTGGVYLPGPDVDEWPGRSRHGADWRQYERKRCATDRSGE